MWKRSAAVALAVLLLLSFTASAQETHEAHSAAWREVVLYVPGSAFPVEMRETDFTYDFTFKDETRATGYHAVLHREGDWLKEVRMEAREQRGSHLASLPAQYMLDLVDVYYPGPPSGHSPSSCGGGPRASACPN